MRVGLEQDGIAVPVLFSLLSQHHSCAIAPCRFGPLRGKYVHRGQDSQASDDLHQTGDISQRPRAVTEKWMSVIKVSKPEEVPSKMVGKSTQRILPSALQLGTSRLP